MNTEHYNPHGQSLIDYLDGETDVVITVHDERREPSKVPVGLFFRGPEQFPTLETAALDMCRGRVLDIGAGAGCHALVLQARGLDVVAIDFLPECVEVCRRRGVRDARVADIHVFDGGPYDTLLGLMNGLAVVPRLEGLRPFLERVRTLVAAGGRFVVDSCDLRAASRVRGDPPPETLVDNGRYFGEKTLQLEYKGRRGSVFTQLYVDPDTLIDHAGAAGWSCEIVEQDETGRYLARLSA